MEIRVGAEGALPRRAIPPMLERLKEWVSGGRMNIARTCARMI